MLEIRSMKTLLAVLFLALPVLPASAQTWPAKPVKIIVPFAPGGSADTLGRLVGQKLSEQLKQSFVVENRPGAGGVLGSELAAKAPPDGYRSEEHTSELQSRLHLVCRLLLEKKKKKKSDVIITRRVHSGSMNE